jgi:hypothetical protein
MEKHQLKPFERVLVRDNDTQSWKCDIFSHYIKNDTFSYICVGNAYVYCIPYNENTAHLVGTTKPYTPPQPKTYWVEWVSNGDAHRVEYTDEEFENFIKTAVLHNKDIQNFNVRRICG